MQSTYGQIPKKLVMPKSYRMPRDRVSSKMTKNTVSPLKLPSELKYSQGSISQHSVEDVGVSNAFMCSRRLPPSALQAARDPTSSSYTHSKSYLKPQDLC